MEHRKTIWKLDDVKFFKSKKDHNKYAFLLNDDTLFILESNILKVKLSISNSEDKKKIFEYLNCLSKEEYEATTFNYLGTNPSIKDTLEKLFDKYGIE